MNCYEHAEIAEFGPALLALTIAMIRARTVRPIADKHLQVGHELCRFRFNCPRIAKPVFYSKVSELSL
jgi:hypothetical protein